MYFERHVFFCVNKREDGSQACEDCNASAVRAYAKEKVKALAKHGKGQIRINNAGCLDRCGEGPVLVVYPEGVWYSYVDEEDIDEIIEEHLLNGRVVERLQLDSV